MALQRQLALRLRNKSVISHLWLKIAQTPWHILNYLTLRAQLILFSLYYRLVIRSPLPLFHWGLGNFPLRFIVTTMTIFYNTFGINLFGVIKENKCILSYQLGWSMPLLYPLLGQVSFRLILVQGIKTIFALSKCPLISVNFCPKTTL